MQLWHLNLRMYVITALVFTDGILQEAVSIWMQLCSVAHFSAIKIKMGAISSAVTSAVQLIVPILILMTEKWATEQSCTHIEITSCKIPSLANIEWQNILFISMCIITLHCAPEESRSLSFSALVQLTEEHWCKFSR